MKLRQHIRALELRSNVTGSRTSCDHFRGHSHIATKLRMLNQIMICLQPGRGGTGRPPREAPAPQTNRKTLTNLENVKSEGQVEWIKPAKLLMSGVFSLTLRSSSPCVVSWRRAGKRGGTRNNKTQKITRIYIEVKPALIQQLVGALRSLIPSTRSNTKQQTKQKRARPSQMPPNEGVEAGPSFAETRPKYEGQKRPSLLNGSPRWMGPCLESCGKSGTGSSAQLKGSGHKS